jgi:hypothetical protein
MVEPRGSTSVLTGLSRRQRVGLTFDSMRGGRYLSSCFTRPSRHAASGDLLGWGGWGGPTFLGRGS